ncbi:MAG: hypothetical protein RML45_07075 [Acetobacteraceae bacterium]|nr:hypothetical protein [Acetobacteraceae bacterium]
MPSSSPHGDTSEPIGAPWLAWSSGNGAAEQGAERGLALGLGVLSVELSRRDLGKGRPVGAAAQRIEGADQRGVVALEQRLSRRWLQHGVRFLPPAVDVRLPPGND